MSDRNLEKEIENLQIQIQKQEKQIAYYQKKLQNKTAVEETLREYQKKQEEYKTRLQQRCYMRVKNSSTREYINENFYKKAMERIVRVQQKVNEYISQGQGSRSSISEGDMNTEDYSKVLVAEKELKLRKEEHRLQEEIYRLEKQIGIKK